jgi:hypothetical protein
MTLEKAQQFVVAPKFAAHNAHWRLPDQRSSKAKRKRRNPLLEPLYTSMAKFLGDEAKSSFGVATSPKVVI